MKRNLAEIVDDIQTTEAHIVAVGDEMAAIAQRIETRMRDITLLRTRWQALNAQRTTIKQKLLGHACDGANVLLAATSPAMQAPLLTSTWALVPIKRPLPPPPPALRGEPTVAVQQQQPQPLILRVVPPSAAPSTLCGVGSDHVVCLGHVISRDEDTNMPLCALHACDTCRARVKLDHGDKCLHCTAAALAAAAFAKTAAAAAEEEQPPSVIEADVISNTENLSDADALAVAAVVTDEDAFSRCTYYATKCGSAIGRHQCPNPAAHFHKPWLSRGYCDEHVCSRCGIHKMMNGYTYCRACRHRQPAQ